MSRPRFRLRLATAGGAALLLASSGALAQDALPPLPDGQGPLYTPADAMMRHLAHWAETNPRLLSLGKEATDPQTGQALALAVFTRQEGSEQEDGNGSSSSNDTSAATAALLPRDKRARVFITCGIHARELITVDSCFALLRLLASPRDADALALLAWPEMRQALDRAGIISPGAASSAERALPAVRAAAKRLAGKVELTVMPLLNPTGRGRIEREGAYALRVNGRGVDLNRNMPTNWQPPTLRQRPGQDTYPGPSAASEWETRAVNAATSARGGIDAYVDLHSGFVSFMGPSAASACGLQRIMPRDAARAHQRAMASMQRAMPSPTVAGPTARVLYAAAGTTLDDAFAKRGARVSMAVEIYDDQWSTRAGYSCPSYEAFWGAPCDEGEDDAGSFNGGGAFKPVRCVELPPTSSASAAAEQGARRRNGSSVPRVPDGELTWREIDDEAKLRALMVRHGVAVPAAAAAAGLSGDLLEQGGAGGESSDDNDSNKNKTGGVAPTLVALQAAASAAAAASAGARRAAASSALLLPVGADGDQEQQQQLPERAVQAEPWWRQDAVMRHASGDWADEGWNYLTTFNPTRAAEFRDVVSRWVAALWLFAADAERQQSE